VWSIAAGGNAFASASAVRNEAYFRAASHSEAGTIDLRDTETTSGSVSRIGDTYHGSSTTTTENSDIDYVKNEITITIECFADLPETNETVLTASYVVDSLQ